MFDDEAVVVNDFVKVENENDSLGMAFRIRFNGMLDGIEGSSA